MYRRASIRKLAWTSAAVSAAWAVGRLMAADPAAGPSANDPNAKIQLVQQPPPVQPPPVGATTIPDAASVAPPSAEQFAPSNLPGAAALGTQTGGRAETNTVNPVAASVNLAGGQAAPVLNAPDLGEILSKSPSAAGVEV